MNNLTKNQLIKIHNEIEAFFGTTSGIKNEGLLESAVERPNQIFYGKEVFPDIYYKAASLFEAITRWHMFIDGNKRTALVATQIFLLKNGFILFIQPSSIRLVVNVARKTARKGKEQEVTDELILRIKNWIEKYSFRFGDDKKLLEIFIRVRKQNNRYSRLLEKDPSKAHKLFNYWLALDIYPEYRDQKDKIKDLYKTSNREILNLIKSIKN